MMIVTGKIGYKKDKVWQEDDWFKGFFPTKRQNGKVSFPQSRKVAKSFSYRPGDLA